MRASWTCAAPHRIVATPQAARAPSALASARDMSSALELANIRSSLIRQEDTIIFGFIERSQFCRNLPVYTADAIPVPGYDRCGRRYSLLEYVLRETERLHGSVRRYTSPDEHAFFPDDLPPLALPPITYPSVLHACAESININQQIWRVYLEDILPGPSVFEMGAWVERRVVERVRRKVATFGQDVTEHGAGPSDVAQNGGDGSPRLKVSPDLVARVYEQIVMPLTKEVEVLYLLRRLEGEADGAAVAPGTAAATARGSGATAAAAAAPMR
ncbi:Chorismate mutase, chloroplastic [Tetrabaena socialis]|uniref:chorismate mutase n=1 Tax=Tetrabaena socialis TaxID=47790 RepID=A0A2J7ZYR7_9CHLO|nr:Chorismate mutase, chloroplastic [Tetrabaena socialis]|eukprot:PNH05421.1 Chorismate mutase, chloroplastic [Tetrabaena socialis]